MNTKAIGATVTGARHARLGRNGQDGVAAWSSGDTGCVVVCDGCGSGASSEVGARLGAQLFARALAARIADGVDAFTAARTEVVHAIAALVEQMPGDRLVALREHFLFTVVAATLVGDAAIVWAVGDGAYAIDGRTTTLGPFPDNQPPYVAYDLVGAPPIAHVAMARASSIVVATDGAEAVDLEMFSAARFVAHPDALRRQLAVLARTVETVDWDARRVVRVPSLLQDDCAIGLLRGVS